MSKGSFHISIKGMGIITPAGSGLELFGQSLFAGDHQFRAITEFDTANHRTGIGAEISQCDYAPRRLDPTLLAGTDLFGLEAGFQALHDAGLLDGDGRCLDSWMGIVCATAGGAISGLEAFFKNRFDSTPCDPRPLLNSFCLSALATNLAKEFIIAGPRTTIATVCSSSGLALARGFEMLLTNESIQHVLVASSESLSEVIHGGFNALRSISSDLCQPFDVNRKGLILGEAGCAMVLSRENNGKYGFFRGYGLTTDLYHFTAPNPDGDTIAATIYKGLRHARISPTEVDYINCHGTGTPKNDAAEAMGIATVFAGHKQMPASSTKSIFGHTLGSASLLEAIGTLLAMGRNLAPPTANLFTPDDFDLDLIANKARPCVINTAISNSFAFGGSNITLVFSKKQGVARSLKTIREAAVITGIGVVSPLGVGCEPFAMAVAEGKNGLSSLADFGEEFYMQGGLVDMAGVRSHIPLKRRRKLNRLGSFLTVAVQEALSMAGLVENVADFGMVYGSAFGCSSNVHQFYSQLLKGGATSALPREFMFSVTNAPAALVAQHLGITGEVWVFVQDEASWEAALHFGTTLIETGKEKRVIVAAADELNYPILAIHAGMGFFDQDSYVLGEGCVSMVLEAESDACVRQAGVLGTVKSCKMVQDVSCGPMDFCANPDFFEKLHDEVLPAQGNQLVCYTPNNHIKAVEECCGDLLSTSTFDQSILAGHFIRTLLGDSGVAGGFGLAAGLLGRNGKGVYTCTASRGGILAGTLVSL